MNPPVAPTRMPSTLTPGVRFGNYQIVHPLGCGGMGEVYQARDLRLGRDVALKVILVHSDSHPEALSRFQQEARAASALNHPNIVCIYELGDANGKQYIAMELVAGQTLHTLLASGPIPFRKAVAIAAQIAAALAKAHETGIVHRDLKPDNIMVSADGTVKVLDFGLAKLLAGSEVRASHDAATIAGLTEPGRIMGTVGYMSPEQASGDEVDFRSDQFSFGTVLYEMLTGRPAFRGKTAAEILAAILRDEPERINPRILQAPAPFHWILERCLAKDPNQRYASTHDLARDIVAVRDRIAAASARQSEPRPNNLPAQRTAFIGREGETAALRELLSRNDVQLVTLTGAGGIGKTRLAFQVARDISGQFPGGVCFVALSAVSEAQSVLTCVAKALGVSEAGSQTTEEGLKEYLAGLRDPMLLLLDNFEHLVSAAPTVADLLSTAPKLRILITSQAPLHVYGEYEFPVPPFSVPQVDDLTSVDSLARLPAIALFVERAQALKPEFRLTRDNSVAIAAICTRLDGLPLAIELAAARIKLLSPVTMQARLESSLSLLTGGARDLPARQQTIRNTVDWSYGLLNSAEQTLFRRLSVFVGGCTLEGVEAVCDTGGDLGLDVLDGMASMVDKSLVQRVEQEDGDARFTMLSTIREYALERLVASGDEPRIRRAHAAYCLVLAEEGADEADNHPEWLDRFDLEHDNFRAALDYLIVTSDAEWGLRLGAALFRFWETREHLSEGRDRTSKLLNLQGAVACPKLRARVLFAAAVFAGGQGDYHQAQNLFEESLEACRALHDDRGIAVALNALAVIARDRGNLAAATSLFEQCVAIWKDLGKPADVARALSNLANAVKLQGDLARASALYLECLGLFRKVGDRPGAAWTLNYLGDVARESGDMEGARSFYTESLAAFRQIHDGWGIASALSDLAALSRDQDNREEARRLYGESLKMFRDLGHKRGIARVLESLAVSHARHDPAHCLRLAGAAAGLRQRLGAPLTPSEQARFEAVLDAARQKLSDSAGLTAWMEGWDMPIEQAIHDALGTEPATGT